MKPGNIIASIVIISLMIVIVSLIVGSFIMDAGCGCGTYNKHTPAMTAKRVDNTTVAVTLQDMGGASSVKGLRISVPVIANPDVVSSSEGITVGQAIVVTDSNLTKPSHLVAISAVDGTQQVVVDTQI